MYTEGSGVPQDFGMAVSWYRKAAEQGLAEAQANLGVMFDEGLGIRQNLSAAAWWYRRAAEQGIAKAQTNLANMYEAGHGPYLRGTGSTVSTTLP